MFSATVEPFSTKILQSRKSNLILIGEPGVGKTGIVEGFAQLLVEGKLPVELGRPAVIEVSLASLVAGTKYRGEFEGRVEALVREASLEPKPILFIDEIHLLLGAGKAGGSVDAAKHHQARAVPWRDPRDRGDHNQGKCPSSWKNTAWPS